MISTSSIALNPGTAMKGKIEFKKHIGNVRSKLKVAVEELQKEGTKEKN